MRKRGQITLFIIIGITILITAAFLIFISIESKTPDTEKQYDILSEFIPIDNHIKTCLEKTAKEGVFYNSLQGGYLIVDGPKISSTYTFMDIPIYYNDSIDRMPTEDTMTRELNSYIENNIPFCFDDFSIYKERGFAIEYSSIKARSTFTDDSILVELDMPLTISSGENQQKLGPFNVEFSSDMPRIYSLVRSYINEQDKKPGYIRTSYLAELAAENDMLVSINEHHDDTMIFQFITGDNIPLFNNYTFNFAVTYDWGERVDKPDVYIEDIPDMTATIGYQFTYQVIAHGDDIRFSDNSPLFDIDSETGLIEFTPEYEDSGEHIITIRNRNEMIAQETFKLTIEHFGLKPRIDNIGYLNAEVGTEFAYQVKASSPEGLDMIFLDDSELFDIDPHSGIIRFTPDNSGNFAFNIRVIDTKGHQAYRNGYLIIT